MSKSELLPIGSIIILKGSTKKMMLIARLIAVPVEGKSYLFDYGACLYPEGLIGDNLIYFNDEDILKIVHKGFSDEDDKIMLENISNTLSDTNLPRGNVSELLNKQNTEE